MDTPAFLLNLVRLESKRLDEYLVAITPEAWSRQSACDGWMVSDVVGHLVFWAEPYTNFISRAAGDEISPPEGWPASGSLGWQPLMDFISETAIKCREDLGEQLLPTFRSTNERFAKVVEELGPEDWDKPSYHPAAVGPVRTRVQARIVELAVHGWDIRSQLEPAAPLPEESMPVVIDMVGRRATAFLGLADFRPGHQPGLPVRYRFDLGDSGVQGYDLVVEDDGCRMEPSSVEASDVTFRCGPETFALTGLGRIKFKSAMADGRLEVEGDQSLAAELMEWTG